MDNLPDGASQGFQKAKGFLTKTALPAVNRITETTNQATDTITRTAEKTRDSLRETTAKAVNTITEDTNQAADTVTEAAEKTKSSLTEITGKAVSDVNEATSRAVDAVTATTEQARDSLVETIQRAEKLNGIASESVQNAISSYMNEWIDSIKVWVDSHPAVFWLVQAILWAIDHPILALVIVILLVFILQRLLRVLSSLAEKALVSLLQAPLKFGQFLLRASSKLLGKLGRSVIKQPFDQVDQEKENTLDLVALSPESVNHYQKERLANILTRLEVIRQEQNQLLQEVAAIVASDKSEQGGV